MTIFPEETRQLSVNLIISENNKETIKLKRNTHSKKIKKHTQKKNI